MARRVPPDPRGGGPDPRRVRLLALLAVVVCAVALPLAAASAGSVAPEGPGRSAGSAAGEDRTAGSLAEKNRSAVRPSPRPARSSPAPDAPRGDAKAPSADPDTSPLPLGLGPATAVRCGPELTSPDGIEAQTCVVTQGDDSWARTYYRNATGEALDAVLSFMGPGGRTVRMHCAVGAEDEPGTCETPRERLRGEPAAYTAVAEFARRAGSGPLLLRSGSNSPTEAGS
ncbi:hypothetical protein [Streptomyces sp. TRM68367]|uniref:hypothetical protein n=1 Tax=Streptomyces sp. TRM68367 TaxID=2758415 RepID=UPI00165ACA58|nr:hypothetical protein [Streptomyces sp. TRM68367]MBC9728445.1 hypothetical protein [Streptomyces sp. TRM68367]